MVSLRSWLASVAPLAVADRRTETTELATGLGMLGAPRLSEALDRRPPELLGVDDEAWGRLERAVADPRLHPVAEAAFTNGMAFSQAPDGLRGRRPLRVEWKGPHRPPGYDLVPADLRVDHVYLVSCKYQSRLLLNASPSHLFDRLLQVRSGGRPADWYEQVAPDAYRSLYQAVRSCLDLEAPAQPRDLSAEQRQEIGRRCARRWPPEVEPAYQALCRAVSAATAARWQTAIARLRQPRELLWRLLRLADCPYFVLGSAGETSVRLRIDTPWDFQQRYRFVDFHVEASPARQPQVDWTAVVVDRSRNAEAVVRGHVEIRWSHGRFCGMPEAKVYLDTPLSQVPGYHRLDGPEPGRPELPLWPESAAPTTQPLERAARAPGTGERPAVRCTGPRSEPSRVGRPVAEAAYRGSEER